MIVIILLALALFAYLPQIGKEVGVEQLVGQRAVKALTMGILDRASGLNPGQFDLLAFVPSLQHLADQFGAVAHPNPGEPW